MSAVPTVFPQKLRWYQQNQHPVGMLSPTQFRQQQQQQNHGCSVAVLQQSLGNFELTCGSLTGLRAMFRSQLVLAVFVSLQLSVFCGSRWTSVEDLRADQEPLLRDFAEAVEQRFGRARRNPKDWSCSCSYHACGDFFSGAGQCFDTGAPGNKSTCDREHEGCSPNLLFPTQSFVRTPPHVVVHAVETNRVDPEHADIANDICIFQGIEREAVFQTARRGQVTAGGVFVGTLNGAFSSWPGRAREKRTVNQKTECKPYDPRVRPWFLSAISPRKFLILITDSNAKTSTEATIDNLLRTLSYNDYVSILNFDIANVTKIGNKGISQDPYWLWEATQSDFNAAKAQMDEMEPVGVKAAFNTAFRLIWNPSVRHLDKIIVFLSGSTVKPVLAEDILTSVERWQSPKDFASILAYTFAPKNGVLDSSDDFPLRLTCGNSGIWVDVPNPRLPDMSTYMSFLALPSEFQRQKPDHIHYTSIYDDAAGLGDIITVSKGYYDYCDSGSPGPQWTLLGVAGYDIKVADLVNDGLDKDYREFLRYTANKISIKNVEDLDCQLEWIRARTRSQCPGQRKNCDVHNKCREQKQLNFRKSSYTFCNWLQPPGPEHVAAATCCSRQEAKDVCLKRDTQSENFWPIVIGVVAVTVGFIVVIVGVIFWRTSPCFAASASSPPYVSGDILKGSVHIGSGASGKVKQGIVSGEHVAIKVFSPKMRRDFNKELGMFRRIPHHENVIRLLGVQDSFSVDGKDGEACLILELMDMNLDGYLENVNRRRNITYKMLLRIFHDIASGLAHLHKNKVIHRDLKPQNILVKLDGTKCTVKLCDFGHGKEHVKDGVTVSRGMRGTWGYMSPELTQAYYNPVRGGRVVVGPATDIYSLGVLMCQCIVGQDAFQDPPWDMPEGIKKLVLACRRHDGWSRPTAPQVCRELSNLLKSEWRLDRVFRVEAP